MPESPDSESPGGYGGLVFLVVITIQLIGALLNVQTSLSMNDPVDLIFSLLFIFVLFIKLVLGIDPVNQVLFWFLALVVAGIAKL